MSLKNLKKIFFIIILVFSIILQCNISLGAINIDDIMSSADSFVNGGKGFELSGVKDTSDAIYSILFAIGGVIALCVGVYLGIKFMTSTVDEKAKVKESLIAYVVGCIVIFGAFGIWKIVINLGNSF